MTKIASPIGRSVKEWIGKTPDHMPPPAVRVRIFDRAKGICHICKIPIKLGDTWHCDHVQALVDGGENRESNMAPAHAPCNLEKASGEKTRKAKSDRVRARHIGTKTPTKNPIQSQGFPKAAKGKTQGRTSLPPRRIYEVIQ